jgi:hypothetical protein
MFHLSDPDNPKQPTLLRPNLITASRGEPVNAGMFILEPRKGDWELLEGLIEKQQQSAKNLPYPHFSKQDGWGHNFVKEGDPWEAINKKGNKWAYHASHSDQGLLYYWTKYFKQDVSIVIGAKIQNWVPDNNNATGKPKLLTEMLNDPLKNYSVPVPLAYQHGCDREKANNYMGHVCRVPYRDFAHFMGKNKPWQNGYSSSMLTSTGHWSYQGASRIWFQELVEINANHNMGINFTEWEDSKHLKDMKESPLGYIAKYTDNAMKMLSTKIPQTSENATDTTKDKL